MDCLCRFSVFSDAYKFYSFLFDIGDKGILVDGQALRYCLPHIMHYTSIDRPFPVPDAYAAEATEARTHTAPSQQQPARHRHVRSAIPARHQTVISATVRIQLHRRIRQSRLERLTFLPAETRVDADIEGGERRHEALFPLAT